MFTSQLQKEIYDLMEKIGFLLNSHVEVKGTILQEQQDVQKIREQIHLLTQNVSEGATRHQLEVFYRECAKMWQESMRLHRGELEHNQAHLTEVEQEAREQLLVLSKQHQQIESALISFQREWQEKQKLQMPAETTEALARWLDGLETELKDFLSCGGTLRLFARRLGQHLRFLREQDERLKVIPVGEWQDKMEELHRTLFYPDLGVSWNDLGAHNCQPAQREKLRLIETGILNYRSLIQEKLRLKTGIMLMEVVPGETRFDAKFHESNDYLVVPTSDTARNNMIVAIERPGYILKPLDGSTTRLLQAAIVRRYVCERPSSNLNAEIKAPQNTPDEKVIPPDNSSAIITEFPLSASNEGPISLVELRGEATPSAVPDVMDTPTISLLNTTDNIVIFRGSSDDEEKTSISEERGVSGQL